MRGCPSKNFIILLFPTFNRLTNEPTKNRVDDYKFSPGMRFVYLVTKLKYLSDSVNLSIRHSGDILASVNFNALIKLCFFKSFFTLWALIFRHIFATHKHLINLQLQLSIFITFNSYSFSSLLPLFNQFHCFLFLN